MKHARSRRTFVGVILSVGTLVASLLIGTTGAAAAPPSNYYLALGDSVAFGYAPPQVTPPAWYFQPSRFRGYAEDLSKWLGLRDINASCPGETTASLINKRAQSNGCEDSINSETGYRDLFPLHVKYGGSQLGFAAKFLSNHLSDTSLVSINVGANDIFVCQETTPDECTGSDFAATLNTIASNLTSTLSVLRATGYTGTLVVLQYYSIDYNDPIQVAGTMALDSVLAQIGEAFGAVIADGYTAFKNVADKAGGDPCAAGLLIRMPDGSCNIHPSAYGHNVLAHAIQDALG
jgi:lysophospholipase L1-like esterase